MPRRYAATNARLAKPDKGPVAPADNLGIRTLSLSSSPADGLTPASLIALLRNATGGAIAEQAKLFEAMEDRDPEIAAHMGTRRAAVLAEGWQVLPDDEADDQELAERAAGLVTDAINHLDVRARKSGRDEGVRLRGGFDEALVQLLSALGHGFAVVEPVWDTSAKQWWWDHWEWRPQRWFQLAGDELRLRTQSGSDRLNPDNLWVHVHRGKPGTVQTGGMLRQLARPYVISNYSLKDILAFGELYGQPMRVGYYTPGMSSGQKEELWKALYYLATDACALLPDGTRIEFPEVKGSSGGELIYEKLLDLAGKWKALIILGQLSTVEEGGSYAKAKALEAVRYDLRDDDAARLEATARHQMFAPLVRLNLGPDAPVPKLSITREAPRDLKALIEAYTGAAAIGVRIPRLWAQEQLGIPEPADDDEVLEAAEAGTPPTGAGAPPSDRTDTSDRSYEGEEAATAERRAAGQSPIGNRQSAIVAAADRPPEKKAQAHVAMGQQTLRRLEEAFDPAEVEPLLDGLLAAARDAASRVLRAASREQGGSSELAARSSQHEAQLKAIRAEMQRVFKSPVLPRDAYAKWLAPYLLAALLAGMYDVQQEAASVELRAAGQSAIANRQSPIVAAAADAPPPGEHQAQGAFFVRPQEAIDWFRQKAVVDSETFARLDDAAKARAFSVAQLSDQAGLTVAFDSIDRALKEGEAANTWLTTLEDTFASAGMALGARSSYWRLVFNQNTTLALGAGRWGQMRRVKDSRPYWLAWNPKPVTDVCMEIAGKVFRADHAIWTTHYPPNHFGCKTLVVTLDGDELADEGLDVQTSAAGIAPPAQGFAANPADAFFLNAGVPGMEPTPEGEAALKALTTPGGESTETP